MRTSQLKIVVTVHKKPKNQHTRKNRVIFQASKIFLRSGKMSRSVGRYRVGKYVAFQESDLFLIVSMTFSFRK